MSFTENAWKIFNLSVEDYHIKDDVNSQENNPFQTGSLEWILYSKNWIDTVQWHLEDIIREENIDPTEALKIKRRIDALNQKRKSLLLDTLPALTSLLIFGRWQDTISQINQLDDKHYIIEDSILKNGEFKILTLISYFSKSS